MKIDNIQIEQTFDNKAVVKLSTSDLKAVQNLKDKYVDGEPYTAEIKRIRPQRSMDANAYCWVLCHKIAESLGIFTDEDIYKEAIRKYGVSTIVPISKEAMGSYCRKWQAQGLGADVAILGKSKIEGYVNVKCFWGSSKYDSAEMSRLIDGLIEDAKELNIETLPPEKIEELKQLWE